MSAHEDDEDDEGMRFGDWAAPVNLGPPVNTADADFDPDISRDGRTLYFGCAAQCTGVALSFDIWFSQRASEADPWGPPQSLGPAINTASNERDPALSDDGHWLYFTSNRPGGTGGDDLYVSYRPDKRDPLGWEPPVNLGSAVNTAANERAPALFRQEGKTTLYFGSDRPGGAGLVDIYTSRLKRDRTFGPAVLVPELSSASVDTAPDVRRDGLEVFLSSNRSGTLGNFDLWVSTRASQGDPWSPPVNLGPAFNGAGNDGGPSLSFDGTTLYFHATGRPGNIDPRAFDIWYATRSILDDEDDDDDGGDDT